VYTTKWVFVMLKNITLSADEDLIKKARKKSQKENTTLNENFRKWLSRYVSSDKENFDYYEFKSGFRHVKAGKTFSREELNER